MYEFKRRLINQTYELIVSTNKERESNSYKFDYAKTYWNNIPKSEGASAWNSKELLMLSNKKLIEQFNKERENL